MKGGLAKDSKEGGRIRQRFQLDFRIVCEGEKNDRDEGTIGQRLQRRREDKTETPA